MQENSKKDDVNHYLRDTGMLLCNENPVFPSLCGIGGDWETIMSLIEEREVFHSKVFRSKTTYLSREMYFYMKGFKQKKPLGEREQSILRFLEETGGADSEMVKNSLLLESKDFNKSMDILLANLYATVLRRGKKLNENWTTLVWGTYSQWESGCEAPKCSLPGEEAKNCVIRVLARNLPIKEIERMLK